MPPTKHRRTLDILIVAVLAVSAITALTAVTMLVVNHSTDDARIVDTTKADTSSMTPKLHTEIMVGGLDHPWEVAFLPNETMLITERGEGVSKVVDGKVTSLNEPSDLYARGEGGMLGLAVDPDYDENGHIYTCMNSTRGGPDVRVVRWVVNDTITKLSEREDIVTGLPSIASGRHSGCRIGFGADGNIWIGTGDAAQGNNPQDLHNLGGKVLRVDRDGKGVDGNLGGKADPRIYSYGHRNIQGMAFYGVPRDGSYGVSVEHGSYRDDEVNALVAGNFGWAPRLPYDESVPMTDTQRFPNAIKSIWSSGDPTVATGDADFLVGKSWGKWQGRLAVAILKDRHLRLLEIVENETREQLRLFVEQFGRLRAVTMHEGSLYVTTDNGDKTDYVLRIYPEL